MKTMMNAPVVCLKSIMRLLVTFSLLAACVQLCQAASKGTAVSTPKGKKLYTQFSLFYEGSVHRTTNYRKGILVPINTEVTFVKATKSTIVVALPDGKNLTIKNVEEYSGEAIDGIFERTFGTDKVDLSKFSEADRASIPAGEVKPGMKKEAVVLALGYPPKHKTPSLHSDQWRFWRNRFNTFVVHFQNGFVTRIQD